MNMENNIDIHDLEDGEIIDDNVMDFALDTDISFNISQSTINEDHPRSTPARSDKDEEVAALALLMLNDYTTQPSSDLLISEEKCSSSSSSRESRHNRNSSRSRYDKRNRRRRRTSSSRSVRRLHDNPHRSSAKIGPTKYNEYPSTMSSDRNSQNSKKVEDFDTLLEAVKQKIEKSKQRKKMEQTNNNGASAQEIGTSDGNHVKHSACGNAGMSSDRERRYGLNKENGNNSSRRTGKRSSSFTPKDNAKKHCSESTNVYIDDTICVKYLEGTCTSEYCQRVHSNENWNPRTNKKIEICKFYLQDVCIKRNKCFYMHAEFPCKYYYLGLNCVNEKSCKFAHGEPLSDELRQVLAKHVVLAPQKILGDFHRLPYDEANVLITNRHIELCQLYNIENTLQMGAQSQKIPSLLAIKTTNPNEEFECINPTNTPVGSANETNDIDGTSVDDYSIMKLSGILSANQIQKLQKLGISDERAVQFMTVAQLIEAAVNNESKLYENELELLASTACSEVSALGTQEENDSKSFVPSEPSFDQKLIPPIIRMPTVACSSKDIDMRFGAILIPYRKISFADSEDAGNGENSDIYSYLGEIYDNDLNDSEDECLVIDESHFPGCDEESVTNHIDSEVENGANGSVTVVVNETDSSHSVAENENNNFDGAIEMDANFFDSVVKNGTNRSDIKYNKKETNCFESENDIHSFDSKVEDNANCFDSEDFDNEQSSIEEHFVNSETSSDEYIDVEALDDSNMDTDSEAGYSSREYAYENHSNNSDIVLKGYLLNPVGNMNLLSVDMTFSSDTSCQERPMNMVSDFSSQRGEMPYDDIQVDNVDDNHVKQSELITDLPCFLLNSPWYITLTPEQKNLVQQYMIFLINELNSYTSGYANKHERPDFNLNSINGNYVLRLILLRLGYFVNEKGRFFEIDPEEIPPYQVNDSSDWIMYRNDFVEQDMQFLNIVDPFVRNIQIVDENPIELQEMFEISYDCDEESE